MLCCTDRQGMMRAVTSPKQSQHSCKTVGPAVSSLRAHLDMFAKHSARGNVLCTRCQVSKTFVCKSNRISCGKDQNKENHTSRIQATVPYSFPCLSLPLKPFPTSKRLFHCFYVVTARNKHGDDTCGRENFHSGSTMELDSLKEQICLLNPKHSKQMFQSEEIDKKGQRAELQVRKRP